MPSLALRRSPGRDLLSSMPVAAKSFLVNLALWSALTFVHSLSMWSDATRRGRELSLPQVLGNNAIAYAPWVLFGTVLYLTMAQAVPSWTTEGRDQRRLWPRAALVSLAFYLPEIGYQVALAMRPSDITLGAVLSGMRTAPAAIWLIDFALLLTTNAIVMAIVAVRTQRQALERQRALDAENLTLRLELEQRRLQGLRAQLEPHFLFNALNAISGLVRNDDKRVSISALQQLSRLLRYAITASAREWVTLDEELTFVREYLSLQRLRYGERLHVRVLGDDLVPAGVECPPLWLQPLVENAIRHDLERTELPSDIDVCFSCEEQAVSVAVRNNAHPGSPPNPGLGLGLAATRDRLQAAYGGRASLSSSVVGSRFEVHVRLPLHAPD